MKTLLNIFFLTLFLTCSVVFAHHYKGEIEASNEFIEHHKKWAKTYHGISDKKRFQKNIKELTNNQNASIKPKKIIIKGMESLNSLKSYKGKGEMGIVKGAPEHAFKGKEFWSVTVDFSKCGTDQGFSDCKQTQGSSRKEIRDKKKWTFVEGTEKWIHYAFKPAKNIVFKNKGRKYTIGQCHPGDKPRHAGIVWMLRIRQGNLYIAQYFKHFNKADRTNTGPIVETSNGTRYYISDEHSSSFNGGKEASHILLKKLEANEHNGTNDWTSVLIHQVQSMDHKKGLLEIFLDENYNNPAYVYKGEMGIETWNKCYIKIGLYSNGNVVAKDMATTENMNLWLDAMVIGNTKDEVLKKVAQDK